MNTQSVYTFSDKKIMQQNEEDVCRIMKDENKSYKIQMRVVIFIDVMVAVGFELNRYETCWF